MISEYFFSATLPEDASTYVTRQADKELFEALKAGKFSYVLNSRQTGKSSLRVQVMRRLEKEGFKCAAIDLSIGGSQQVTAEQWYAGILRCLKVELELNINLVSWWREREWLSPLERFREFIESILLVQKTENIVIFIDEIDSVLSLDFPSDDFFAFIRACYNQRVDNAKYKRLTFCLLGVATPSDLIADKQRTPFNIGQAIELKGFTLEEAKPYLIQGLTSTVDNPEFILAEVLDWTAGQPFLTQKLCYCVVKKAESRKPNIQEIVHKYIIDNWESQDNPQHLKTIRDRIFKNKKHACRLLGLYQPILQEGEIASDDSPEQMQLRLSGLVVKKDGKLKVSNRIYKSVFNLIWVKNGLENLRPYAIEIDSWLADNCQNKSRLLQGKQLQEALKWSDGKSLSDEDYRFLNASQELAIKVAREKLELVQLELEVVQKYEIEAKKKAVQAENRTTLAQKKAKKIIRIGSGIFGITLIASIIAGYVGFQSFQEAQTVARIERDGVSALQQFKFSQLDALRAAMFAGWELKDLLNKSYFVKQYPPVSLPFALQMILDNIHERNQILTTLKEEIKIISFSPDGKQFVILGNDGVATLLNLSGKLMAEFKGHQSNINSVNFSPDGQLLATGGSDGTIRLWKLSGQQVDEFKGHQGSINSVSFNPNGQQLATTGSDGVVRLWNLSGQQLTKFQVAQSNINNLSFSPNGKHLATAGNDGIVRLWKLSGQMVAEFQAHQDSINSISFSPNGQQIATGGNKGILRLWKLSGQMIAEFKGHQGSINSISFSPNGQQLATGGSDGTIKLWKLSGQQVAEFKSYIPFVTSISFSSDGKLLATAGKFPCVIIWDLLGQKLPEFQGEQGVVNDISFSPDGQQLATVSNDGILRLWNLLGRKLAEFKVHHSTVFRLKFSFNGKQLATLGDDRIARLWDLSGQQLAVFKTRVHQGGDREVSFSPDSKHLITLGDDSIARLWNLSAQQLAEFKEHQGGISSVSVSPNGQQLATGGEIDGTVKLWKLSGKLLAEFKVAQNKVSDIAFSRDGKLLAVVVDYDKVKLLNISGKQLAQFQGQSVSFSPNGKHIVTIDGIVAKLWNFSGQQLAEFGGQHGYVHEISFSPDGKLLAIAGKDGKARLVRVEGLDELLARGCDWLQDFNAAYPDIAENLQRCKSR